MAAFLAEIGIITYRDISSADPSHKIAGLPVPADYLAAVALFGVLGLAPKGGASNVAALLGWGFVIATALRLPPALLCPTCPKTTTPAATGTTQAPTTTKGVTTP